MRQAAGLEPRGRPWWALPLTVAVCALLSAAALQSSGALSALLAPPGSRAEAWARNPKKSKVLVLVVVVVLWW